MTRDQILGVFTSIGDELRPLVSADTAAELVAILFFLKCVSENRLPHLPCAKITGELANKHANVWEWLALADDAGHALIDVLKKIEREHCGLAGLAAESELARMLADRRDLCQHLRRCFIRLAPSFDQWRDDDLTGLFQELVGAVAEHPIALSTPAQVTKLLVAVLGAKSGGTIYDPTCGSGGFLCAAANAIGSSANTKPIILAGQEVRKSTALLARIAILLGGWSGNIQVTNSLVKSAVTAPSTFDYVLANPPYARDVPTSLERLPSSSSRRKSIRSEVAFVDHVDRALSQRGRGVVLVPTGFLNRRGYDRDLRKYLIDNDRIEAVITLPLGLFIGASAAVAMLVLSAAKSTTAVGKVKFLSLEGEGTDGITENVIDRTSEAIHDWGKSSDYVTVVAAAEIKDHRYDLRPSRYAHGETPTATKPARDTKVQQQSLRDARNRAEHEADNAIERARDLLTRFRAHRHGNL